jgi:hypothetical protein
MVNGEILGKTLLPFINGKRLWLFKEPYPSKFISTKNKKSS